jgi:hypothetical protein
MALLARSTGNTEALKFIKRAALWRIAEMLKLESPRPEIDYGYVYIIYPMRRVLLQALVNIGDASVRGAIRRTGNIDYYSKYFNAPLMMFYVEEGTEGSEEMPEGALESIEVKVAEENPNYFTIRKEKQEAIEYLDQQATSQDFIEPPEIGGLYPRERDEIKDYNCYREKYFPGLHSH